MEEKKNHTAEYAAAAAAAARRVRADVANESRAFVRESCVFPSPPSSSGARTDGGLLLVLFFANAAEVYTRYRRDASARRGGGGLPLHRRAGTLPVGDFFTCARRGLVRVRYRETRGRETRELESDSGGYIYIYIRHPLEKYSFEKFCFEIPTVVFEINL